MDGLAERGANTIPEAEWPDSIQRGGSDGLPATCRGVIRKFVTKDPTYGLDQYIGGLSIVPGHASADVSAR